MAETTAIYWTRYGYHIKDAAVHPVASALPTSGMLTLEQGQALADLMNMIDKKEGKGQWVSDTTSKSWNFGGCVIEYNGLNQPSFSTKGSMKNVLILMFPEGSICPFGRLYIPYNDPEV